MKNQNCEARFTYRGFSVGSTTVQIRQGSNTVAQLTLTASTDPRIASINFPCGDLSSATTLRVQQATASLTGTNELSGLYLGLATNLANVSQAEEAGKYTMIGATNCIWGTQSTSLTNLSADSDCNTATVTGAATTLAGKIPGATFSNLKPGKYMFVATFSARKGGTVNDVIGFRLGDGTTYSGLLLNYVITASEAFIPQSHVFTTEYTTVSSPTIQVQGLSSSASNAAEIINTTTNYKFELIAYRFPTSSELVVTPERQNTFGAVQWPNGSNYPFSTTSTSAVDVTNATYVSSSATYFGGAKATTTANAYGLKMENIPVGVYRISAKVNIHNQTAGNDCTAEIHDNSGAIGSMMSSIQNNNWNNGGKDIVAIYRVTSVQSSQDFKVKLKSNGGTTTCWVNLGNGGNMNPSIVFEPLDQPSNSALYVQGPVKASATGDAIPSGYQMEGITRIFSTLTSQSSGGWKTGTGVTLQPGVYFVDAFTNIATVAPTRFNCALTKTVNGGDINDDRSFPTLTEITEQGNTLNAKPCKTYGYFRVTSSTTFYPTVYVFTPVSSSYLFDFYISAIRLN
jgi:hypothetical protein